MPNPQHSSVVTTEIGLELNLGLEKKHRTMVLLQSKYASSKYVSPFDSQCTFGVINSTREG